MTPLHAEMQSMDSTPGSLALRRNRHLQRPKRLLPINPISEPSLMGTLVVSLPSGRVLDVSYATQTTTTSANELPLDQFVSIGDNLTEKLDGKGAQVLTLQAFCGSPKPRMFARLKSGQITRPCSFVCEFTPDPTNPSARIATIRVYGIQSAQQSTNESSEFMTRHNANCGLIYFDAASVPFLGHFPSETTGSSLFSIIHAEDVPLIHDIHRDLRAGKRLARSSVRFVAHDGRIWCVNSEWAAFTNPWTNCVEMIVAKHRVVSLVGQVKPTDVLLSEAQCRENDLLVRSILETPNELLSSNIEDKTADQSLLPPTAVSPPLTKTSGESSPARSPDLLLSYNQINCLENVHRLLKSQSAPATVSSQSTTNSTTATNQSVPLTSEHLGAHDKFWQAEKTRSWTRRLQLKRANAPASTSSSPPVKISRTEMNSPFTATTATAPSLLNYLGALIDQQQRNIQPTSFSNLLNGLLVNSALSATLRSGDSTPSNL
ncbi:Period circadian protein like protein 1 [Aphelenchoides besseyi]|nr:Period circadian protein like protein 1 [Aphelenchoides besseyi]KAI6194298.1 Period circadian protein like protein 1 [Aphelenchoides besseyi]